MFSCTPSTTLGGSFSTSRRFASSTLFNPRAYTLLRPLWATYWTRDQRARYLDLGPQGVRIEGSCRRDSLRLHFLNDTTTPCRIRQRRLTPSSYDINTLRWLWFWPHKACVSKAIDFLNDAALPCRLPVSVDSSSHARRTPLFNSCSLWTWAHEVCGSKVIVDKISYVFIA